MSIASELTKLAANRDAIKAAIEAKGVTVSSNTLAAFPAAISQLIDPTVRTVPQMFQLSAISDQVMSGQQNLAVLAMNAQGSNTYGYGYYMYPVLAPANGRVVAAGALSPASGSIGPSYSLTLNPPTGGWVEGDVLLISAVCAFPPSHNGSGGNAPNETTWLFIDGQDALVESEFGTNNSGGQSSGRRMNGWFSMILVAQRTSSGWDFSSKQCVHKDMTEAEIAAFAAMLAQASGQSIGGEK